VILSEIKYDLNSLKEHFYIKNESIVQKEYAKTFSQKKCEFTYNKSVNQFRVEMIEKLRIMRSDCTGFREIMAFVYYNECVQVYDRSEAKDKLIKFNDSFPVPLKTSEIRALTRKIDKITNQKNIINCYNFTNSKIIERLDMNDAEQTKLQFFPCKSGVPDKNRSRNTKRKNNKDERNKKIIELYQFGCDRALIAEQAGCCIRTVYSVILKYTIINK
jgi:hypothetical protein